VIGHRLRDEGMRQLEQRRAAAGEMMASRLRAHTRDDVEDAVPRIAHGGRTRQGSLRSSRSTAGTVELRTDPSHPQAECGVARRRRWFRRGHGEIRIRPAEAPSFELQRVEREAGVRFRGLGLIDHLLEHSLPLPELSEHQRSGRVWVAADEHDRPVGFAVASVVGGGAHLEELDVLPEAGRHGIGTRLVATVCEWAAAQGFPAITLSTFRDVP
jgi:ribosomal protein S18 acetylase RimI-like enzyme